MLWGDRSGLHLESPLCSAPASPRRAGQPSLRPASSVLQPGLASVLPNPAWDLQPSRAASGLCPDIRWSREGWDRGYFGLRSFLDPDQPVLCQWAVGVIVTSYAHFLQRRSPSTGTHMHTHAYACRHAHTCTSTHMPVRTHIHAQVHTHPVFLPTFVLSPEIGFPCSTHPSIFPPPMRQPCKEDRSQFRVPVAS